ncbi:hypothetical protein M422DRAFT_32360 [Sphaerobolus stellatus SS14]|uniref:Nephrocystin 3-like N-terminal domain-containing protein n=1 Tax=Sphaerobolus stellatus (strain SS14) TaxID=990650 RepID=A0A0C9VFY5_SPHS4|nr:hypothetical protein M422DRAFT_32360 [Sphaerobolus stellatus SS14]
MKDYVKLKINSKAALAYLFFSYTDQAKQRVFNILSSVAAQLCRRIPSIPPKIISLYEESIAFPPPIFGSFGNYQDSQSVLPENFHHS